MMMMRKNVLSICLLLVVSAITRAQMHDYPDYQDYANDYENQDNLYANYAEHAEQKAVGG